MILFCIYTIKLKDNQWVIIKDWITDPVSFYQPALSLYLSYNNEWTLYLCISVTLLFYVCWQFSPKCTYLCLPHLFFHDCSVWSAECTAAGYLSSFSTEDSQKVQPEALCAFLPLQLKKNIKENWYRAKMMFIWNKDTTVS